MRDTYVTPDDDDDDEAWLRRIERRDRDLNAPSPLQIRKVEASLDVEVPLYADEGDLLDLAGTKCRRRTKGKAMLRLLGLPDDRGPFSVMAGFWLTSNFVANRGEPARKPLLTRWEGDLDELRWAMIELGFETEALELDPSVPKWDRLGRALCAQFAAELDPYIDPAIEALRARDWFHRRR